MPWRPWQPAPTPSATPPSDPMHPDPPGTGAAPTAGDGAPWAACRLPGLGPPDDDELRLYRAGLVHPVAGPPVADGAVVTRGGRVAAVGRAAELRAEWPAARVAVERPRALLLPGLVDAHCHLALTFLQGALAPTPDFTAWIQDLLRARRGLDAESRRRSVLAGLREVLRGGCTALGDIAASVEDFDALVDAAPPLRLRAYREFYGWPRKDQERALAAARREAPAWSILSLVTPDLHEPGIPAPGLSPHAPYSTHPDLFAALVELAVNHGAALSTHLAETAAEAAFTAAGGGPFRALHRRLGWRKAPAPWGGGRSPVAWLAERVRGLAIQVVHGTHLDDEDIRDLVRLGATVAYCPGSVAWFHDGGDPHPVERLLAAGVPVALGTDSLASSPTLNLPLTCTLAARAHPGLEPETLLEMATRHGARSLALPGAGALAPGGPADFVLFELPELGWRTPRGEAGRRRLTRDAVAAALTSGYRAAGLTVVAGAAFAFAALDPFPA
ncbi:MAG: amidohydrolase family protein [Candidatus Krumholzibacteriota bacterium]|nr:amidohydrolase family protein [Candidatus Krumholzibacteriota bacterium]